MILGFDIGGTKCAVMTAEVQGENIEFLKKEKCATRFDISPEEMIESLIKSAENILDGEKPEKIGICCGGPLDSRKGVILGPPNLPGWNEVHISEQLSRHFGVPALLQNDANACAVAEWKFGAGMVGSFMCDLNGTWSSSFMTDANGKRFLWNAVEGLMPTSDIRPKNITVSGFTEDNYINSLGVITDLEDGQYVRGTVIEMDGNTETDNVLSLNETTPEEDRAGADSYVTESLGSENQYSRCSFVVKAGAVYKILLEKCNADGTVVDTLEFYKSFSYSAEYDTFADDGDRAAFLSDLSYRTSGNAICKLDNPWEIFADFITAVNRTFDPTAAMIIAAIVLFLLDIAVRKFKFKWIHELVREHKEKKAREKAGRPVEGFRGEK